MREARGETDERCAVVDRVDVPKDGGGRASALALDRPFIDARRVGVTDLLLAGRAAGCLCRRGFENPADDQRVAIGQLVEAAVAGSVGRERAAGQPRAARELVEVGAGVGAAIEVVDAEAGGRVLLDPPVARRLRRCSAGEQQGNEQRNRGCSQLPFKPTNRHGDSS